jgi:kynureninase
MPTAFTETDAFSRDASDPLAHFRNRFFIRPGIIYLDGNSLGLLSHDAESAVLRALESWKTEGINGWLNADPPWFTLGETLGARMAVLVGAPPESVVVTGTTTGNLHQMLGTFYRPEGTRRKIIATCLDFPSDIYALQSHILLHGGDPARDLVRIPSRDDRTIDESDIIAAIDDTIALVLLQTVLYRSGQLLDIPPVVTAAHNHGAIIGLDCAHSVGVLPHDFTAWNIDFAIWCSYKYLNAGPGATGALYVHPKHFGRHPALAGWWGYRKDRQFEMDHAWEGAPTAAAWQISTIPLLATTPLLGALTITEEAGIAAIRQKSLQQTSYLIDLVESSGLCEAPYHYRIGTPREPERRGGHVAIEHDQAPRIAQALKHRGIIVDFRPPDVIRIAPVALYTTWHELWQAGQTLRDIIDHREHEQFTASTAVT